MFSRQHRKTRPFFVIADILLIWLVFEAAYFTRTALHLERIFFLSAPAKALLLLTALVAWTLAGFWLGIYDATVRTQRWIVILRTLQQCFSGTIAVLLVEYIQRIDLSRPFLALLFLYSLLILLFFRIAAGIVSRGILGRDSARRFLYVAGTGETAQRVGRILEKSEPYGLHLAGFLDERPGKLRLEKEYEVKELGRLSELLQCQVVDEIIFAMDSHRLGQLEEVFLLCEEEGVRTRLHVDFFPHFHGRVDLERIEGEDMLTFAGAPHDDVRLLVKRAVDLVLAVCALIVLAPALVLIATLIRITSPGPAIFKQQRCGLNGRRFTLYKFRTMVADAERRKAELEHLNVKKTAFKIPNDPRLTAIGGWLRKYSLDELPQLWNIVRGEMSIVGPRPPVPEEVEHYQRWQRRRLRMRPGLTCLWTLAGRDALDFEEWMRLDLEYIDNWSLAIDASILLRTIPHVLMGRGAN